MKNIIKKIITIDIEELKPSKYQNPRKYTKNDLDRLKKSLIEYPQMLKIRPIICNADNFILAGHMRVQALKQLNYKKIEVLQVKGLTEKQEKILLLRDNQNYGIWDFDILNEYWDFEELKDFDFFDIRPFESEEKEIKNEVPEIIYSYITLLYEENIKLRIDPDTAEKLNNLLKTYKNKNGNYENFIKWVLKDK